MWYNLFVLTRNKTFLLIREEAKLVFFSLLHSPEYISVYRGVARLFFFILLFTCKL